MFNWLKRRKIASIKERLFVLRARLSALCEVGKSNHEYRYIDLSAEIAREQYRLQVLEQDVQTEKQVTDIFIESLKNTNKDLQNELDSVQTLLFKLMTSNAPNWTDNWSNARIYLKKANPVIHAQLEHFIVDHDEKQINGSNPGE